MLSRSAKLQLLPLLLSLIFLLPSVLGQDSFIGGIRGNAIANDEIILQEPIETIEPIEQRKLAGTPECPPTLNSSVTLFESFTDTLIFHYAVVLSEDPSLSILCARLERDREGWLAFGISSDGKMIGSTAVVGLPDEGTVKKYDMRGKSTYLIDVMPYRQQTLMDESIVQEDGRTILTFTKYLQEDDEEDMDILASGENLFLYAAASGNVWQYHGTKRGSFALDFEGVSWDGTVVGSGTTSTTATTSITTTTSTTTTMSTTTTSKATTESPIATTTSSAEVSDSTTIAPTTNSATTTTATTTEEATTTTATTTEATTGSGTSAPTTPNSSTNASTTSTTNTTIGTTESIGTDGTTVIPTTTTTTTSTTSSTGVSTGASSTSTTNSASTESTTTNSNSATDSTTASTTASTRASTTTGTTISTTAGVETTLTTTTTTTTTAGTVPNGENSSSPLNSAALTLSKSVFSTLSLVVSSVVVVPIISLWW